MIKLDFYGSTHGHFLEYVTNVYILRATPKLHNIFTPGTFSCHEPKKNKVYAANSIVRCGHYTFKDSVFSPNELLIRIALDSSIDKLFFIALTNLMYKAGDIGLEEQLTSIPDHIRNDPVAFRNTWYSKINEREQYAKFYSSYEEVPNDIFYFPFESFFDYREFCLSLNKLACFLNQTFFPDESLYQLWLKFIEVNQGWQSYIKCEQVLEHIFSNRDCVLDLTVIEQGWINYNVSKICRLYSGKLFNEKEYLKNAKDVYVEIQSHLANS